MGQLQTSQMELEALCAQLAPVFFRYLQDNGVGVERIEEAVSLDGITSLPARYSLGGVEKNVLAPLSLLRKGVDEAIDSVKDAEANAVAATNRANLSAVAADKAAEACDEARKEAENATMRADEAAGRVHDAIKAANDAESEILANEAARQISEQQRELTEQQREEREAQRMSAERERAEGEAAREEAEAEKAAAEKERVANETSRLEAESAREKSENQREQNADELCQKVKAALQLLEFNVPAELVVENPGVLAAGGADVQIKAQLLPKSVVQNILFLGDDNAVSVSPTGLIKINKSGESVIHVIPTNRVELWQKIRVVVRQPYLRLSESGGIRLTEGNRLRIG